MLYLFWVICKAIKGAGGVATAQNTILARHHETQEHKSHNITIKSYHSTHEIASS